MCQLKNEKVIRDRNKKLFYTIYLSTNEYEL